METKRFLLNIAHTHSQSTTIIHTFPSCLYTKPPTFYKTCWGSKAGIVTWPTTLDALLHYTCSCQGTQNEAQDEHSSAVNNLRKAEDSDAESI